MTQQRAWGIQQAATACERLAQMLANDDGDSTDFIDEQRDFLIGILGAQPFHELKKAADAYEFQKARELLVKRLKAS